MVYVEWSGPPPVMTIGCTSMRKAPMVTVIKTNTHKGFNSGRVMSRNFCHELAWSISAAS